MILTPVACFLGIFGIFQAAIAVALLAARVRSPLRVVLAALFALNAAASALAALVHAGWSAGTAAVVGVDAPTGVLVLLAGSLIAAGSGADSPSWSRATVAASSAAASLAVAAAAVPILSPSLPEATLHVLLKSAPLYAGYLVILVAVTRDLVRSPTFESPALLVLAFGARAAEFGTLYGATDLMETVVEGHSVTAVRAIDLALKAALFPGALAAAAVLADSARRSGAAALPAWWAATGLAAFVVLGLVERLAGATLGPENPGWYAISFTTLILVRPLLTGLAYERQRTWRILAVLGPSFGVFLLAKGALSSLLGTPFAAVGYADAAALCAVAVSVPALLALLRRPPAPRGVSTLTGNPSAAPDSLVAVLASLEPGTEVSAAKIEERTGISRKSLAAELRRAEQRLREAVPGPPPTTPLIESRAYGVRGAKLYRLSPLGSEAARRLRPSGSSNFDEREPPESPGDRATYGDGAR